MSDPKRFLSADEVIQQLGINKATLYSYVSRGTIRSEETEGKSRRRRYFAEDVDALLKRKEDRRNPERVAESALQWGDPVLESAITLIEENRLYYRGIDALELAKNQSFEEVAALLWEQTNNADALFSQPGSPLTEWVDFACAPSAAIRLRSIDRFQLVLPVAGASDWAAFNFEATAVANSGARILQLLTAIATAGKRVGSIAQQLQKAWAAADETVAPLINSALILCADHELNASSFTARCAASAGSTPYAVVNAGLSALQGYRHGGHTERVEALFREATEDPGQTIVDRLKRGESIAGFGHQLYPDGDPRAKFLLAQIAQTKGDAPAFKTAQGIIDAVERAVHLKPNIDFALVALAQSYALPAGAPLTLFAIGRVAGWIGHAIEQYQSNRLIRPRARYVGNSPLFPQSSTVC